MILPYDQQPFLEIIGDKSPRFLAGFQWRTIYMGMTHRGFHVYELSRKDGRRGRSYSTMERVLVVLDHYKPKCKKISPWIRERRPVHEVLAGMRAKR